MGTEDKIMPILVYKCPSGHETEFLKLKKREPLPKFCKHPVFHGERMDTCGLPLKREKVVTTNWQYVRGKNPNWPLTHEEDGE